MGPTDLNFAPVSKFAVACCLLCVLKEQIGHLVGSESRKAPCRCKWLWPPMTTGGTGAVNGTSQQREARAGLTGELHQTFKGRTRLKPAQQTQEETLPRSPYEASIVLIPNQIKTQQRKRSTGLCPHKHSCKNSKQNSKPDPAIY